MKPLRILSPTALLGYGFPDASLAAGMDLNPDIIAVDAGSTDGGPAYLGYELGQKRGGDLSAFLQHDLRRLLRAALGRGIPLVIGSAGIAGGDIHLMGTLAVIQQIAREEGLSFRLATVRAEIDKSWLKAQLRAGRVRGCGPVPALAESDVDAAVRLVGQMGWEPIATALEGGAEVVLAGRASDPALFAALPIARGYDPGLALHLAKILECGAIAAEPGSGSDGLLGTLYEDRFTVEPLGDRVCSVRSVAAHSLYEQGDPTRIDGPGGHVDLTEVSYVQESQRRVGVRGSRFVPGPYRVKVEGARRVGYRAVALGSVADPHTPIDALVARAREEVGGSALLHVHVLGRGGQSPGIVLDVVAETQALATSLCGRARSAMLHHGFPGRRTTAGNLAFPWSPCELGAGPACAWCVYHLVDVENPQQLFPIHMREVA